MKGLCGWLLLVLLSSNSFAQVPYSASYFQETKVQTPIFKDSSSWTDPKKATVLALVLPGAGQIYNKRYWKAGIVYAGAAGLIYMFKYNTDSLNAYQSEYSARLNGDTTSYANISTQSIKNFRDFHRRYRDVSILGFVGLYALQAIDANVDAHLKEFRINKDLSLKASPIIYEYKPGYGYYNGLSLKLKF